MAAILYALISSINSPTPLVEYSSASGNFQQLALKILSKKITTPTISYSYEDKYIFHCLNIDGFTFLCLAESAFTYRTAYAFLYDIKDIFMEKYGERAKNAIAFSLNKDFSDIIKKRMIFFNTDKNADKLRAARDNIEKTKDIMIENIDKVIAREEKIEMLVNKTQYMSESSFEFRREAVRVKRHFWWKNTKFTLLIFASFMIVLFFILVIACGGFNFKNC
ncbi:unnamed protein product [Blepharisma stoltei]|uniref:Vesicle-associated membrane protein 7 n=1 Tax=Blepharisma stoltei TaxID=1481888 RepID=A0AAU9K0L0_9CILI|nr:unnamed protein product [Blepharisma stoltei]